MPRESRYKGSPSHSKPGQPATSAATYDVFLSHSTRLVPDHEELVGALAQALTSRGLSVFWDRGRFRGGERLIPSLEEAIAQSATGIVLLTRSAALSSWVELELAEMLRRAEMGSMNVYGLLLEQPFSCPEHLGLTKLISPQDVTDITATVSLITKTVRRRTSRLRRRTR